MGPGSRFAWPGRRRVATGAINEKRRSGYSAPALLLMSLYWCRGDWLRGIEAGNRLHLEIFFQAVFAPFTAVTGLLVAAERRGAVVRHALQVDVAGTDPAADLAGGLDGVGGDVTRQTI